jgi:hypothetical protein
MINFKKILISLAYPLALASGFLTPTHAQITWPENYTKPGWVYQGMRGRDYLIPKVAADSASLPTYPLLWTNGTRRDSSRGALAWTIAENKLWKWNGTAWSSVGGTGGGVGITYPNTSLKYLTGYGTFGSFNDSARAALSAGTGLTYNSTTGVFTNSITQYTNALARAALSAGTGLTYNSTTGVFTNSITQYTDALARAAISLTTTGTSGAATYNSTTGVLNVPEYEGGGGGVTTMAAIGSSPNANGATISGSTLTLQPADSAFGGVVTTGTQQFTGAKTFKTAPLSITNTSGSGVRLYLRNVGASDRIGWGINASELQNFTVSGSRFTWNGGGDLQTSGTNEWMRLTSSELTLGTGVTFSPGTLQPFKFPNTGGQAKVFFYDDGTATTKIGIGLNTSELQNFAVNTTRFTWNGGGNLQTSGTNEWMRLTSAGLSLFKGSNPVASAVIELTSTNKGFLPPRMTTAQQNAISSPATALSIFNSTLNQPHYRDGTTWQAQVGMTFGTAAPATTPTAVGNFFLDTTNQKLYVAKGTASSADWVILN